MSEILPIEVEAMKAVGIPLPHEVYSYQEDYREYPIFYETKADQYSTNMDVGRCVADTLFNMRELIDINLGEL